MKRYRVTLNPAFPNECRVAAIEVEAETAIQAAREGSRYLTYLDDYPNVLEAVTDERELGTHWEAYGRGARLNGSLVVERLYA